MGAKTVNGPGAASAVSRPVRCSSFTSVVNCPAATAVSTMFGSGGAGASEGGIRTVSIAWMMPFLAGMSAVVTVASFTWSPPPAGTVNVTLSPSSVAAEGSSAASSASTLPLTTW